MRCAVERYSATGQQRFDMTADENNGKLHGVSGILIWTSAASFPAMLTFYRDTLGLTPRSTRDGFVNFAWGDFRLTVAVHDEVRGKNEDPLRLMVNFQVRNIQRAHARLAAAGVNFSRAPEQEPWGGWIATFQDPDGNTLQLLQT